MTEKAKRYAAWVFNHPRFVVIREKYGRKYNFETFCDHLGAELENQLREGKEDSEYRFMQGLADGVIRARESDGEAISWTAINLIFKSVGEAEFAIQEIWAKYILDNRTVPL